MNDFFSYVESIDFRTRVSALNNLASFARALDSSHIFIEARNIYLSSPQQSLEAIQSRINSHITPLNASQMQFLHPYDAAIAAYLYLLYKVDPANAKTTASLVGSQNLSNIWWARHMISIIGTLPEQSATRGETIVIRQQEPMLSPSGNSIASANSITTTIVRNHND